MEQVNKTKREIQEEIERARQSYLAKGRRVHRMGTLAEDGPANARPRRTRLKMFA